jgi:hypothetical protein
LVDGGCWAVWAKAVVVAAANRTAAMMVFMDMGNPLLVEPLFPPSGIRLSSQTASATKRQHPFFRQVRRVDDDLTTIGWTA